MVNKLITDSRLHKKLKLQISFFILVFVFSTINSSIYFFIDDVYLIFPIVFLMVGLAFGMFVGKYKKMQWDEDEKIINKFDAIGILVLLINIIYLCFHKKIIKEITHLPQITCVSFALVSGAMLGRLIFIFIRIKKMKENI